MVPMGSGGLGWEGWREGNSPITPLEQLWHGGVAVMHRLYHHRDDWKGGGQEVGQGH